LDAKNIRKYNHRFITYSFLIAFTTVCVNSESDGAPAVEAIVEEYREMCRAGRTKDHISKIQILKVYV
jgi:hypothetical protein